jgi:hypothetical protein
MTYFRVENQHGSALIRIDHIDIKFAGVWNITPAKLPWYKEYPDTIASLKSRLFLQPTVEDDATFEVKPTRYFLNYVDDAWSSTPRLILSDGLWEPQGKIVKFEYVSLQDVKNQLTSFIQSAPKDFTNNTAVIYAFLAGTDCRCSNIDLLKTVFDNEFWYNLPGGKELEHVIRMYKKVQSMDARHSANMRE